MAVNYVKFYRGTSLAFENAVKNKDTLYFISDPDSSKGALYLGDKLIGGNIASIADLEDIFLNELSDNQVLVYNEESEKWMNKSLVDAIGVMIGATSTTQGSNGLVPAPGIGQQELFLRGDGTWAAPISTIQLFSDNKTIETFDGHTLSLKDFGQQYYKYIAASGTVGEEDYVASHYEAQIVDAAHPWKAGLEPKVVEENGELVLGWFEPNPTTLDGVVDELTTLQDQINELSQDIADNAGSIETLTTELNTLTQEIEKKANASDVYTKTEADQKISEAVASSQHLKRKTFASLEAAREFATSINDPENYVYMIANENDLTADKYTEYLYVEGALEKVGTWEANLEDYVTDTELALALMGKVNIQEGYGLISDAEKEKLAGIEAGAQKNFITSVEETEFKVDDGKLTLVEIPVAKITNLENLLNGKADSATVETLQASVTTITGDVNTLKTSVSSLSDLIGNYDTRIGNIEDKLDDYVLKSEYETDKALIMASIIWKELG